jgi:hypothetical protein
MNRMIKLFQQRSDQAYEKYLANRKLLVEANPSVKMDSPEWTAAVVRGADLKGRYETWAKAADLLRKEELSK